MVRRESSHNLGSELTNVSASRKIQNQKKMRSTYGWMYSGSGTPLPSSVRLRRRPRLLSQLRCFAWRERWSLLSQLDQRKIKMGLTAQRNVDLVCGQRGAEPHDLRLLVVRLSKLAFNTDFISSFALAHSVSRLRGLRGLLVHVHLHGVVVPIISNLVHFNLWCVLVQSL